MINGYETKDEEREKPKYDLDQMKIRDALYSVHIALKWVQYNIYDPESTILPTMRVLSEGYRTHVIL